MHASGNSFDENVVLPLSAKLRGSQVVEMGSWQSTTANPNALRMREVCHVNFSYVFWDDLDELRKNVKPFLPWADKHFEQERVSGMPINPGETYKEWRYPASAAQHTDFEFSHSYAERYWPRYAGNGNGGHLTPNDEDIRTVTSNRGIRHSYGDLADLILLLANDPTTRQAYLPVWFPEDLFAARKKERVPCTLGYHFICRNGLLDIVYPMRSCDFVRHFRDDVYLTCRLLLWVLENLKARAKGGLADERWASVESGALHMNITSLHCFESDEL